jgi:hypothetical protein
MVGQHLMGARAEGGGGGGGPKTQGTPKRVQKTAREGGYGRKCFVKKSPPPQITS